MLEFARAKRTLLVALLAGVAAGCSSLPDWVNPDTWGDGSEPSTAVADESGVAPGQYPVLADTPSKAPPTTSTDEQKQVSNALVADRAQAQYSSEQLRAGAEPSAAPPAPASAATSTAGPVSAEATSSAAAPATVQPSPAVAPAAAPPLPAARVASTAPPPPPAPAAPSGDAAFGFQPSHAPPLDPSIARMVGSSGHSRLALATTPASGAPVGAPAATVVLGNGNALDANGVAQAKAAVAAFQAKGGQGYVRVVGHAGGAAPATRALERAQACATAVARELMKLGVPAKKVLVEASGSADGEQRRADIYVES
jgi:hypothetical protein